MTTHAKRLIIASFVVAALFFAAPLIDRTVVVAADDGGVSDSKIPSVMNANNLDALDAYVDSSVADTSEIDPAFSEELFPVNGFDTVHWGGAGKVFGGSMKDSSDRAYGYLSSLLKEKGWVEVPNGVASSASFVKEKGRYRCVQLACYDAGDSTSVLVTIMEG